MRKRAVLAPNCTVQLPKRPAPAPARVALYLRMLISCSAALWLTAVPCGQTPAGVDLYPDSLRLLRGQLPSSARLPLPLIRHF